MAALESEKFAPHLKKKTPFKIKIIKKNGKKGRIFLKKTIIPPTQKKLNQKKFKNKKLLFPP